MNRIIAVAALLLALLIGSQAARAYQTTSSMTITLPVTTVAGLVACAAGTKGSMGMVSDALTPVALSAATGGGAVAVPVVCNGTAWIVA